MRRLKSALIRGILAVSGFTGAVLGTLCRVLPAKTKCSMVRACGYLRDHLSGVLWSAARPGIYEFVRSLYFGTGEHCVVAREIAPGLTMELDVSQKAQRRIYTERVYEAPLVAYFAREVKNGDGFADVGANCGYYTLLASQWVGPRGIVHSFEPEQSNFAKLQKQVSQNATTNVVLHHAAVGASLGRLTLNLNPLNEGGHSLKPHGIYFDDNRAWSKTEVQKRFPGAELSQEVEVVKLDDVLVSGGKRWHMKVDVEGAELDALRGAQAFIAQARPDICCEISEDTPALRGLLEEFGYDVHHLHPDGSFEKASTINPGNYVLKPRQAKSL